VELGFRRDFALAKSLLARGAQRIEAEIPQACHRQAEELKRKAWFLV
jgi:hypothetical protein